MKEIIDFASTYWKRIEDFQSSGWNISLKNNWKLYIKSSWYKIIDICSKDALSEIDLQIYNELSSDLSESDFFSVIEKYNLSQKKSFLLVRK